MITPIIYLPLTLATIEDIRYKKIKDSTILLITIITILITRSPTIKTTVAIIVILITYIIGTIGPGDLKILITTTMLHPTTTLKALIITHIALITQKNKKNKPLLAIFIPTWFLIQ